MNDIDDLIQRALNEEEAQWFDEWDEQSLTEMVVDSFRGKSRWLVIMVYVWILLFFALMLVALVSFFRAETTRQMIACATGFLFCNLAVAMLKMWYWMQLNKNAITRGIKRLELQLAQLASRQDADGQELLKAENREP
jgi:hypothetical protein